MNLICLLSGTDPSGKTQFLESSEKNRLFKKTANQFDPRPIQSFVVNNGGANSQVRFPGLDFGYPKSV